MTSQKEIIEGTKRNICGKITRELINETVEVYPIHNYGTVQIGFHNFTLIKNQMLNQYQVNSLQCGIMRMEIVKIISLH